MHITILTIGSRGDIQPYVALGRGLQAAGHQVRIATYEYYRELVESFGMTLAPLTGHPKQIMASKEGRAWLESYQNPLRFVRSFIALTRPHLEPIFADSLKACRGTDLIIYSLLGVAGYHVAEYYRVPAIPTQLLPFGPTRDFASVGSPTWLKLGPGFNYISHLLTDQVMWQPFRQAVNQWRQEALGLEPVPFFGPFRQLKQRKVPVLFAYSPTIVPKPRDWPAEHVVTGYWFLPESPGWQPREELAAFLAAGPPPVYIGFGSMVDRDPHALTEMLLTAVRRNKLRAVLSSGWADLMPKSLPDGVFVLSDVPHAWLFPRMAAVVHHGGAGTTAAGLRAGVPSAAVPFFADQHFWGWRLHRLGVGPAPAARATLTVDQLTDLLRDLTTNEQIRLQAAEIGRQIRAEDGVAAAVSLIEAYATHGSLSGDHLALSW